MRSGFWKLIWQRSMSFNFENPSEEPPEPTYSTELYNLMIDPKEQHDLSEVYPERAESMRAAAENWWNEVISGTRLEGTPALEYGFGR
jgi:hypothetical protein